MAIPETPSFNEIISSCLFSVEQPSKDHIAIPVVQSRMLNDFQQIEKTVPINLWILNSLEIKPTALINRICKELSLKGHPAEPDFAVIFLAISIIRKKQDASFVSLLNDTMTLVGDAVCDQYLISPIPPIPGSNKFNIGPFTLGPLNREKLVYWCEKVKCDYFQRYPDSFRNRWAIERPAISIKIADWYLIIKEIPNQHFTVDIFDYYFELLSRCLRTEFDHSMHNFQKIAACAGATYIDLKEPWTWNGGSFVCIFRNIGKEKQGYFCPNAYSATLNFNNADILFPAVCSQLETLYDFTELSDAEIHFTISSFCDFVIKGRLYREKGLFDEAFLHYVIALDLLFGEKDSSNQSISKRTATLVFLALGVPFAEMVQRVKNLYNIRSRYVHAGEKVSEPSLEYIEPIIREAFTSLLRVQSMKKYRGNGALEFWIKNIDYLSAAIDADKIIADDEYDSVGISKFQSPLTCFSDYQKYE